ncbi:hypothetical protein PR048_001314 [Dryococelus australis]|uniref:Uncharacterized protein n=1 Tax=Dryococelus australis TaxID=614101 RepID=A0ABQ9IJF1_9NEOP|nr:hypothetical protein PR048_001314 [Dryococelus australis]
MEQRRNARAGESGAPREKPPASGIVQHEPPERKSGNVPAGNRTQFALMAACDCMTEGAALSSRARLFVELMELLELVVLVATRDVTNATTRALFLEAYETIWSDCSAPTWANRVWFRKMNKLYPLAENRAVISPQFF